MTNFEYRELVDNAHVRLDQALRLRELIRKPCEVCGCEKSEGHHDDYRIPLAVRWLCRRHHKLEHNGNSRYYQFLGKDSNEPRPDLRPVKSKPRVRQSVPNVRYHQIRRLIRDIQKGNLE